MDRKRRPGRRAWPQRDGGPQRREGGRGGREGRDRTALGGDRREGRPRGEAREQRPREGRPYGGGHGPRRGERERRPRYEGGREDRPRHGSERGTAERRTRPYGDRGREGGAGGRPPAFRPHDGRPAQGRPHQDRPWQEGPRQGGPRHELPWNERPRQAGPRQDRPRQDRPRQDRPRHDRPRQEGWRPREEGHRGGGPRAGQAQAPVGAQPRQQAVRAKGHAGELGLDGHLRVVLGPIDMALAEQLPSKGGAPVLQPRGDRVGRVLSIVGTLQRPVAIVELDGTAREHALALRGREVHIC